MGLGTAAAGSAVAFSTGAFTNLSADRSVTVNVAADSNAALSIDANDGGNPAGSQSAATANITTADYDAYATSGTAFGTDTIVSPLPAYAGDPTQVVSTDADGKVQVNMGDYTNADGVNQGVVVFEDLIRVQNNENTALSLGTNIAGSNPINLDLLAVDQSVGGGTEGETVSILGPGNSLPLSVSGMTGVTLMLDADTTTTETIDVTLTAES